MNYICGHRESVEIDVGSSNTATVDCRNERHRSRRSSRRAGDRAQRNRAGEAWTGPNRWRHRRERGVVRSRVACTNHVAERGKFVSRVWQNNIFSAESDRLWRLERWVHTPLSLLFSFFWGVSTIQGFEPRLPSFFFPFFLVRVLV